MSDTELLQSFVRERSEPAFRTLVERHLPLVFGTARRITGNASLAEDAAQAVFILLAQKAPDLGPNVVLSGWLYRTASFIAKRALISDLRRQKREQESITMQSQPDPAWEQIAPKLDSALASLSETDRNAVLLRFFEQQSYRDVGAALGVTEEAAKKRGLRALEKLRRILGRRGAEISVGVLTAGLAHESAQAAMSVELGGKVLASAMVHGTAGAGVGAGTSVLVREGLAAWRWVKIKLALLSATGVILTALLISQIPKFGVSPTPVVAAGATNASMVTKRTRNQTAVSLAPSVAFATQAVRIVVLDAQSGRPIEKASVYHDLLRWSPEHPTEPLRTDSKGAVDVSLPIDPEIEVRRMGFQIQVSANGFASRGISWICTTGYVLKTMSTQHVVQLERGMTLAGTVVNENGLPQSGVKVSAIGDNDPPIRYSYSADGRVSSPAEIDEREYDFFTANARTDARGKFELQQFPVKLRSLLINCESPTGSKCSVRTAAGARLRVEEMPLISFEALKGGTAQIVLADGMSAEGMVVNAKGEPLADALVVANGASGGDLQVFGKAHTDQSGHFRIDHLLARETVFVASKDGWATATETKFVTSTLAPLHLQLPTERPIQGRVVDAVGKPIQGARVHAGWDLSSGLGLGIDWTGTTDAQGRFVYRGAPTSAVELSVHAEGFGTRVMNGVNGEHELLIGLTTNATSAHITGHVVDAITGKPIERFLIKISHEMYSSGTPDGPSKTIEANRGELDFTIRMSDVPAGKNPAWILQIESEGYDPVCTRVYTFAEGDQELDFALHQGGVVAGMARTPDGKPASQAQLGFAKGQDPLAFFHAGNISSRYRCGRADDEGRFKVEKRVGAVALVIVHDSGWAALPLGPGSNPAKVRLQAWGRIEGTVLHDDTNRAARVYLKKFGPNYSDFISVSDSTTVKNDGQFSFEYVAEGEYELSLDGHAWRNKYMPTAYERQTIVRVKAGETRTVKLGEDGRGVQAKFFLADGKNMIDWSAASAVLSRKLSIPTAPNRWDYLSNESYAVALKRYTEDPAIRAAMMDRRDYVGHIDDEGIATFRNVLPGTYDLSVQLVDLDKVDSFESHPTVLARAQTVVTVTDAAEGDDALLQLGEFRLDPM